MIRYLKNNPVPAFDPDTVQILCGSLDLAWQAVEIDKAAFKVDANAAHAREVLAKHNETAALSLAVDNAPDDAALKVRFEAALNRFGGPEDYIIFSLAISLIGLDAVRIAFIFTTEVYQPEAPLRIMRLDAAKSPNAPSAVATIVV